MSVYLYVWTITVELNDLRSKYLAGLFNSTLRGSLSKVKVVDQSSRSQEEKRCESGRRDLERGRSG